MHLRLTNLFPVFFRLILIIVCLCTSLVPILIHGLHLIPTSPVLIAILAIIGTAQIFCLFTLYLQPTTQQNLSFKVPLVPVLPAFSVFVNVYLVSVSSALSGLQL